MSIMSPSKIWTSSRYDLGGSTGNTRIYTPPDTWCTHTLRDRFLSSRRDTFTSRTTFQHVMSLESVAFHQLFILIGYEPRMSGASSTTRRLYSKPGAVGTLSTILPTGNAPRVSGLHRRSTAALCSQLVLSKKRESSCHELIESEAVIYCWYIQRVMGDGWAVAVFVPVWRETRKSSCCYTKFALMANCSTYRSFKIIVWYNLGIGEKLKRGAHQQE